MTRWSPFPPTTPPLTPPTSPSDSLVPLSTHDAAFNTTNESLGLVGPLSIYVAGLRHHQRIPTTRWRVLSLSTRYAGQNDDQQVIMTCWSPFPLTTPTSNTVSLPFHPPTRPPPSHYDSLVSLVSLSTQRVETAMTVAIAAGMYFYHLIFFICTNVF